MPEILEPTPASAEPVEGVATEQAEPLPLAAEVPAEPLVFSEPKVTEEKAGLRFAEDILGPKPDKPEDKAKKKKRKGAAKEGAEDGIRIKKRRRDTDLLDEDEEL
jgi:hypothetical protein